MAIKLDRNVIIDVNLDDGKIVKPNNASYYNTDSNIAFFYVKLRKTVDGIVEYIKKEDAYKYTVKMKIVKPKSLNVKSINGIMSDDIIDGDYAFYKFTIDNSLMNEVGNPFCYISIVYNEQELVTDGFTYSIKQDPLGGYNAILLNDPDMPLLKSLLEEIKNNVGGIDDENIRDDKSFSSYKTTQIVNELYSQIKDIENITQDLSVNIKTFGAKCNGIDSDSAAIQEAINFLKQKGGGTLLIPKGTAVITETILIDDVGIYIKGSTPYKSKIKCSNSIQFNGECAIYFKKSDSVWCNKGIGMSDLSIDCSDVPIDGIKVEKAYDQTIWSNLEVLNVYSDNIAFNFTQSEGDTDPIGQTVLMQNCIGYHTNNNPTAPVYKFLNYQESTLIGCKAFSGVPNSNIVFSSGTCFEFAGCRGITMVGCSNAFCHNGILIRGNYKDSKGFTIIGHTSEECYGNLIETQSEGGSIDSIFLYPVRIQLAGGKIQLNSCDNSVIYSPMAPVELVSGLRNTIYVTSTSQLKGTLPQGNSVIISSNYNEVGLQTNKALQITGNNTFLRLYNGTNCLNLKNNANTFQLSKNDNTVLMEHGGNYVIFNDSTGKKIGQFNNDAASGYTNLFLLANVGTEIKAVQVRLGMVDSAGTGYRTLIVPNNL